MEQENSMQSYEVLKVLEVEETDEGTTVTDTDSMGEVEFDIEEEDSIIQALEEFGLDIPFTWDIQTEIEMGIVDIYDEAGTNIYQLRSN
jgi:hypothetical protein